MKNKFIVTKGVKIVPEDSVEIEDIEDPSELSDVDEDEEVTLIMKVAKEDLVAYGNAVSNQNKINWIYEDIFRKYYRYEQDLSPNYTYKYAQLKILSEVLSSLNEHFDGQIGDTYCPYTDDEKINEIINTPIPDPADDYE